jgi:initiation factor 1A
MPKNTRGGGKHRGNKNKPIVSTPKPEDIAKSVINRTVYGLVLQAMGDRRFKVKCQSLDDPLTLTDRICRLRGKFRRNITKDDYVLVEIYEFNQNQSCIISGYKDAEVNSLKHANLWDFPNIKTDVADDSVVQFADDDDYDSNSTDEDEPKSVVTIADTAKTVVPADFDLDAI